MNELLALLIYLNLSGYSLAGVLNARTDNEFYNLEFNNTTVDLSELNSTSFENVTSFIETQSTTTLKPIILNENELKLNRSVVIVWEKCGLEARTEITQIFQSLYYDKTVSLSYNPSINVLIYEVVSATNKTKQVLKLPNLAGELLFFMFNEPGKINIFLDCPSTSKNRFAMDFDKDVKYLGTYQNAKHFETLSAASTAFKCSTTVSIIPGTIIHLNGQYESHNTILLISFIHDKDVFSLTLQNGNIVTTTSSQQINTISLSASVTNGLYLVFTEFGLHFFLTCPSHLSISSSAAYWNTTIFSKRINIETSQNYYYGSASTTVLLASFCSSNNIFNLINSGIDCISKDKIESNMTSIYDGSKQTSMYLPDQNYIKQIELFNENNPLNFGNLVENEVKILFASRDHAEPNFFDKTIDQYAEGFSNGQYNYWIGLDILHRVTKENNFKLKIVASSSNGFDYVEEYSWFKVGNSTEGYRLSVGTPLSCCNNYFLANDGALFSTYDNNLNSDLARKYSSGFWHISNEKKYCFSCVDNNFAEGSSTQVWLSNAQNLQVFKTKMYLVPTHLSFNSYVIDSLIINKKSSDFYKIFLNKKFRLIYRGSSNGFSSEAFHANCDRKPKTVTLIESTNGYIFGGYTEAQWDGTQFKTDYNAFIFSLVNDANKTIISKVKVPQTAIYYHPSHGPVFGNGGDLIIQGTSGTSMLGFSYENSEITFLAKEKAFTVKEIEVLQEF